MEENREYHEHKDNCFLCRHPLLKHICTALMVFLGAFAAFYVVTDWHFKRMLDPAVQVRKIDKMMQADANFVEQMARRQERNEARFERKAESYIKIEKEAKNYKITVDLRPFDNNEKNVEVTANGNVLSINAAGASNKHGHERILKISQNYMFDEDVNLEHMTKMREGKDLIIYIPTGKD